jgi:hypothetical protein
MNLKFAPLAVLSPSSLLSLGVHFVAPARHELSSDIFRRAPRSGPMFPVSSAVVLQLLKRWFDVPVGFVLAHHGVRNGVDIALRCLGVPEDFIDAHCNWARVTTRMSSCYAGLSISILMLATSLLPLVRFRPVRPGWYGTLFVRVHPVWAGVMPVVGPKLLPPVPLATGDDPCPDVGTAELRWLQAPQGLPPQRSFVSRRR